MHLYKNLTIIGTSHISIESVKEVEKIIKQKRPDVVALELDRLRFQSLIYNEKSKIKFSHIFEVGIKGFIFNLIGAWIEKKLGKIVGISPGSEMKKAVEIAHEQKARIALIDEDIRIILRRLSKNITWKEKFRFILDIIKNIFKPAKIKFDLRKVPDQELIDKLTDNLKKNYPNVYKVLIEERNILMSQRLYTLMQYYNNVVAIVGAGHGKEIINLIKNYKGEPKSQLDLLNPK